MKRTVGAIVLGAVMLAVPLGALAQQPAPTPGSVVRRSPTMQQTTTQPGNKPLFSIFGLPAQISAPVTPPYCNCPLANFGGQPMRGADAVAAQAGGGVP